MRKVFVCTVVSLLILVCAASPALAQNNIATSLLGRFVSQTDGWWGILRSYALFLFTTTLILEVCLFGIRMALGRSDIAETLNQFVMLLLFAGFIAAVINNYQEWTTGIAITGLRPLTGELTGNSVDAGQPVAMAAAIMEKIIPVMDGAGLFDFGEVYLYVTCMLIIMVIFILISALVILTTCEFYIVANIGVLIVGLGGSKIFKDYAVNVMRYVFAVAVKLFVLQLIVNIGFAIISLTDLDASVGSTLDSIKFVDLFFLIGKSIILLALAKSLPETCAGIINGSAISGGNPLTSMARTAGVMVAGAAVAGAGYASGAASSVKNAHTIAKDEQKSNAEMGLKPGSTLGGMVRAGWNARGDAKAAQEQKRISDNQGSIRNQLASKANAIKAERLLAAEEFSSGGSSQAAGGGSGLPSPGTGPADAPMGASVGGTGPPASPVASAGGSGQATPVGGNAGGFGAADPNVGSTGSSGHSIPPTGNAGGSGQTSPQAAPAASSSDGVQPKNQGGSSNASTIPTPKVTNGTVDFTGSSSAGERDMRTVDPEILNKVGNNK